MTTPSERVDSSLDSNNVTVNEASDPLAYTAPVAAASDIDDDGAMSVDDEDPIKVEDVSKPNFDAQNVQLNEPYSFSPKDLVSILRSIKTDIFYPENQIRDEAEKRKKFRTDDSWRVHNYDHKFSCHAPRAKNAYRTCRIIGTVAVTWSPSPPTSSTRTPGYPLVGPGRKVRKRTLAGKYDLFIYQSELEKI